MKPRDVAEYVVMSHEGFFGIIKGLRDKCLFGLFWRRSSSMLGMRRRQFLATAIVSVPTFRLAWASACSATDGVELGPYFRPNAPERVSLCDPSESGEPLTVAGRVLGADSCAPLAGAMVDVWHANHFGAYDIDTPGQSDRPYRLRSQIRTGGDGGYGFDTIRPGHYAARAPHPLFCPCRRIRASGHTQRYFAGDPRLATDRLVRRFRS